MKTTKTRFASGLLCLGLAIGSAIGAESELPAPPAQMSPWKIAYGPDVPGVMSAAALLDKPAGRLGSVTVRDGHFYTGEKRLRFWGASIAFSGALPTHEQADRVARRLANFGINCIRFHHIDMQPFPNGILADSKLETLSPEALDRLDYFISALKSQGVYADLNLHVSRAWSRTHNWPNASELPDFDKQVDIFYPELVAANKQYARDLLTHVNAYTKARYADESAVAFIEINNEDTLFLWGGEQNLAKLPDPYAKVLESLWNRWLVEKYKTRGALHAAWNVGAEPLGPNVLSESSFQTLGRAGSHWELEEHEPARMHGSNDATGASGAAVLKVEAVDGTDWHLQFKQSGLRLKKGQFYTLSFSASADSPRQVGVSIGQAHEPWESLGLASSVELTRQSREYRLGFVASANDDNGRIAFLVGGATGTITLQSARLSEGGQEGLRDAEDPEHGSVARGGMGAGTTSARTRDWYDFLQYTDQAYFTGMRQFLKAELGVKCPVTGTIGLGPLGTASQSRMDFVDAHAYFEHPRFPRQQWDMSDWEIPNKAMVDDPAGAALWALAATRVAGKPFTVTEYNHPAPNEWQAECVPLIASYAALQDWDGVFLFDYVDSNTKYESATATDFFSIEGNVQKMSFMPLAARAFLAGGIKPLEAQLTVRPARDAMLDTGSRYFWEIWPFMHEVQKVTWENALINRIGLDFTAQAGHVAEARVPAEKSDRIAWTSNGQAAGTGQFRLRDSGGAVFVGFANGGMPIDLGPVTIEKLESPFAALMLVPAEPGQTIEKADRLLLCVAARGGNTGMQWDIQRHSVSTHWGGGPPLIEVVHATLSLNGEKSLQVYSLTPEGQRGEQIPVKQKTGSAEFAIGPKATLWYELVRR